jgi:hypothetical protein
MVLPAVGLSMSDHQRIWQDARLCASICFC